MVRLSIFAAQVAVETGSDDVLLGTYVTKRRRAELQAMFGPFGTVTAIPMRFAGDDTFRRWLGRVRDAVVETSQHTEIPYEQLCEDLGADGNPPPELQAIFSAGDGGGMGLQPHRFAGLEITTPGPTFEGVPPGFCFGVDRWGEADLCLANFDPSVDDPGGVRSFVDRFTRLEAAVARGPDRPCRAIVREVVS
jgi:Condensation domain